MRHAIKDECSNAPLGGAKTQSVAPPGVSKREYRVIRQGDAARMLKALFFNESLDSVAAHLGMPRQHLQQCCDDEKGLKNFTVADASGLADRAQRGRIAEYIAGPDFLLVEIPSAETSSLSVDSTLVRQSSKVVCAHMDASEDGRIDRAEAIPLREEIRKLQRVLAALDASLEPAIQHGVINLRRTAT